MITPLVDLASLIFSIVSALIAEPFVSIVSAFTACLIAVVSSLPSTTIISFIFILPPKNKNKNAKKMKHFCNQNVYNRYKYKEDFHRWGFFRRTGRASAGVEIDVAFFSSPTDG